MSILIQDCATTTSSRYGSATGGTSDGLILSGIFTPGSITINRFHAARNGGSGISIGKAATAAGSVTVASLLIRDSVLVANNPDEHEWRGVQESQLHLLTLTPSFDANITRFGGVTLDNLSVVLSSDHQNNRSSWLTTVGAGSVTDIEGTVTLNSSIGCPLAPPSFGAGATDISLAITCVPLAIPNLP